MKVGVLLSMKFLRNRRIILISATVTTVAMIGATTALPALAANKVTLCHVPPGNPGKAHTITVGEPAVAAHMRHGDYLGPCYP